jgi:flagellar M-ring protein FliF
MWQSILKTIQDLNGQWEKLSGGKKAGVGLLAVIIVACMVALGSWVGEKSYAPLYTNLQPEESIALVKVLQEKNIPYLVTADGSTISIPPELVQQTLMQLAVQGAPSGQKPGLELFDKESFGTSSYVQRINYVRAIQGELMRTINTLKAVRKSAVHVSLPPKSTFLEQAEDPKASVVVELKPGMVLAKEEVRGVQNLVASSVEGLRPERVTVVDSSGVALTQSGDSLSVVTMTMMERQHQVQRQLEGKIEEIVSRLVGRGNVAVTVSAELDFDPLREQETVYDPEQTAIRSQDKQENSMESSKAAAAAAGGVAGAQSSLPGPASAPSAVGGESRQAVAKTNDRAQYEISSKVRSKEKALGAIKRLSVAVAVNHENVTDAEGKVTRRAISDERRATIEKIVRDSIGIVQGRDSVTVVSEAFASEDLEKSDEILARRERQQLVYSLVKWGAFGLFVFLFFVFVVRPFIRWVTGLSTATKIETVLPRTVEELERMQEPSTNALPGLANLPLLEETVDLEKAESELLKEKLVSLVDMSPEKAAQIITDWLVAMEQAASPKQKRK